MNPAILLYAIQILNALPQLIMTGQNVIAVVQKHRDALERMAAEGRDPNPQEWAELNATIDGLRAQLHAPQSTTTPVPQ